LLPTPPRFPPFSRYGDILVRPYLSTLYSPPRFVFPISGLGGRKLLPPHNAIFFVNMNALPSRSLGQGIPLLPSLNHPVFWPVVSPFCTPNSRSVLVLVFQQKLFLKNLRWVVLCKGSAMCLPSSFPFPFSPKAANHCLFLPMCSFFPL